MDTVTHLLVPVAAKIGLALGIVGLVAAALCVTGRFLCRATERSSAARRTEAFGIRMFLLANLALMLLLLRLDSVARFGEIPASWQLPLALATGVWVGGLAWNLTSLIWRRRENRQVIAAGRDVPGRLQQMLETARERMGLARDQVRPVLASPLLTDTHWVDGQVVIPTKVAEGNPGADDRLILLRHLIHSERDDATRLPVYRLVALPWWWVPGLRSLGTRMIESVAQVGREGAEAWAELNEDPVVLANLKRGPKGWVPAPQRAFAFGLAALVGVCILLPSSLIQDERQLEHEREHHHVASLGHARVQAPDFRHMHAHPMGLESPNGRYASPWASKTPSERHVWNRHGRVYTAEYRGHIEPTFDRMNFTSIPKDGFLELTMKSGREAWKLRATSDASGVVRDQLTLNGKAAPEDAEKCHRARLAMITAAYSQTAICTKARVRFAIHRDGFDEALDLVTRCRSGTPRLQWLREMLSHAWLPEEVACVARKASRLLKGNGLHELVQVASQQFRDNEQLTLALVEAVSQHDVAPTRGQLVTTVVEGRPLHLASSIAALQTLKRGCSAQAGAFLLSMKDGWLKHDQLRPQWFHALRRYADLSVQLKAMKSLLAEPATTPATLALAERLLSGSGSPPLEALLPELIARCDDPKLIEKLLSRSDHLSLQNSRDQVMKAAVREVDQFPQLIAPVLAHLEHASSNMRTEALLKVVAKTSTAAELSACMETADEECSDHAVYALVMQLAKRPSLDTKILTRCLESVRKVDSSSRSARLLAALTKHLKDAHLDCWLQRLWRLRSDSDRMTALAALLSKNQLSAKSLARVQQQAVEKMRSGARRWNTLIKQADSASL